MLLEDVHKDTFIDYLKDEFQVQDRQPDEFSIRLVGISDRSVSPRQECFTLLFRGPAAYFLPQGIHTLKHNQLGEFDLFLVPIAKDQQGYQYEAVFNRLVKAGG